MKWINERTVFYFWIWISWFRWKLRTNQVHRMNWINERIVLFFWIWINSFILNESLTNDPSLVRTVFHVRLCCAPRFCAVLKLFEFWKSKESNATCTKPCFRQIFKRSKSGDSTFFFPPRDKFLYYKRIGSDTKYINQRPTFVMVSYYWLYVMSTSIYLLRLLLCTNAPSSDVGKYFVQNTHKLISSKRNVRYERV